MAREPKKTRRARTNIHDVAEAAGVSSATVSHALNGKGRVDAGTRERVLEIARELRYRPNQNAINLLRKRSGMIALTVGSRAEEPAAFGGMQYLVAFVNAATSAALGRGYALVLLPPANTTALAGIEIDGAIIIDPIHDDPVLGELEARAVPVVTSGRDARGQATSWVDNDLPTYIEHLLDHIRSRGGERIGLVVSAADYSYAVDFRSGYLGWCESHGQEPLVVEAANQLSERAGYEAAMQILSRPGPPDAILAPLDRHALGTALAASTLGLKIPEDLMIASATDSEQMESADPPLTALALHPDIAGARAVDLLIRQIDDPDYIAEPTVIPTEVVARASTARAGGRLRRAKDDGTVDHGQQHR